MTESVATITKVNPGTAKEHWEVTTPNGTVTFQRKLENGQPRFFEAGSTFGWPTLNEAVRYLQASEREATEAHGFQRGDKVIAVDGETWEILTFQAGGELTYLHLVGADSSRTCGHLTSALSPAK